VIGVDTNVLVYAHRQDSEWHTAAERVVRSLAEGGAPWAIPWPCLHEFVAIATHPAIYDPPTPIDRSLNQVDAWLESPALVLLAERSGYWERLPALLKAGRVSGLRVHDARVAALCLAHGVHELWTADRDFGRFPELATRNPLTASD
jgi:toxin-antitoxin system PIN domain toxin